MASSMVTTVAQIGGHQDAAKDGLSRVCQRRHGVQVVCFERHRVLVRSGPGDAGWKQVVVADRNVSIPDTAAFRVDLSLWLKTPSHRDRRFGRTRRFLAQADAYLRFFALAIGRL